MPSHLTRNVFRRLLSNDGLVLRCPTQTALHYRYQHRGPSSKNRPCLHRTIFGFSQNAPRKPKAPELAPGYPKMLELNAREKTGTRLPPPQDLLRAFREFMKYKIYRQEPINSLQAEHALRTFKYLQRTASDDVGSLNIADLKLASTALSFAPKRPSSAHRDFANVLAAEMKRLGAKLEIDKYQHFWPYDLVKILVETGSSADARRLMQDIGNPNLSHLSGRVSTFMAECWALVMEGFSGEDNEEELLRSLQLAEAAGQPFCLLFQKHFITLYASRNDIQATKLWVAKPIKQDGRFTHHPDTLEKILEFSIRNKELEWCNSIFQRILEKSKPYKLQWDVIFQWAVGSLGKGVEDIERMMEVMVRRQVGIRGGNPDVATINGLVKLAASLNDPYLAERYIALGMKSGIRPNAQTYILQLDYRIDAGDLAGAQVAYQALQAEELLNDEDLGIINKYIRALTSSTTDMYDRIASIMSDLNERDARLEADTVASLCSMYLSRGEFPEVVDILQLNTYHHDLEERTRVRNALFNFCMDRNNSLARVWQTYGLIRDIFLETDIITRTKLMNEFFSRGRADMACYVFGHMRAHDSPELRPVCETYVQCFEGIARNADRESLDMVHNMMKLDSTIEPTTRLYNSLMMAYTACDDAYRALDFWLAITNSREGPSYNSLEIVFRACGKRPFGDKTAREIWSKMKRMDIEVTPNVFSAYCAALAGQGKWEEVKTLIDNMEKEVGFGPDYMTLGNFYNATKGDTRKDGIEAWAKELYPDQWAELEKFGRAEDDEGWSCFNIVVDINA